MMKRILLASILVASSASAFQQLALPTISRSALRLSVRPSFSTSSSISISRSSKLYSSIAAEGSAAEEEKPLVSGGTATIPNECLNLVKGIVGAGILSLPSGIATFGNAPSAALPAIILIATIGTLSGYGFGLIGRVCALTGTTSYRGAWEESVSKETSWIPAVSVTLKTICATLAYSMILGDTFHSIALSAGLQVTKTATLGAVTTLLLLPLCLLKNLSSLAPFSLLGSLGMVYTAIAMAIRYFGKAYAVGGKFATDLPVALRPSFGTVGAAGVLNPSTCILLGMLSTAYMAHFNAPKFYNELKDNTIPRYLTVVSTSFAISISLFCLIAGLGFLTFGGNSAGLILNNYSTRDTLMGVSRLAVAVSLVFSYPLAFVGARDGILDLFSIKNRKTGFLNALTVGILSGITGLALIIPDVSFVLAFAGATLGNCLIYIFPGLMFRGAIKKLANPTRLQKAEVKIALGSAAVGAVLGVMGAFKAVQNIL